MAKVNLRDKFNHLTCTRCGQCCHFRLNDKLVKCKYLVKIGKRVVKTKKGLPQKTSQGKLIYRNIYTCRIYHQRLGTILAINNKGQQYICINREDNPYDYKGCPYNTDKPIFNTKPTKKD